jgi:hypothetical protein
LTRNVDPDGWTVSPSADDTPLPAPEPADDGLRDIMSPDPEGPDMTNPTPFLEPAVAAPIQAEPSKEWLAKIDQVMRPATSAPVLFGTNGSLPTTQAAADLFANAEAPSLTQPLELVDLEPVAATPAAAPIAAPVAAYPAGYPAAAPIAAPVAAYAPTAPIAPHPVAAVAASIGAAPPVTTLPPRPMAPAPFPVVQPPAPAAPAAPYARLTGTGSARVVDAAPAFEQSFDVDFESDVNMTSAHTTSFEMPAKQRFISQRAAIGLFAGAAVLTVAYLATRGGHNAKTATPPATAQTEKIAAPAAASAATPAPVAAPVAAAAATPAATPAPVPAGQNIAAPAAATQEVAAAPAPAADMIRMPVTSKPSGALVTFVDGGKAVVVGRTPTTISFDPRSAHDVALTLLDHETQLVTIPTGGMTALVVDMGPAKTAAATTIAAPAVAHVATSASEPRHETAAPKHHTAAKAAPAQHIAQPAQHTAPPAATMASGQGMLMISSKPPCEIVVDGRSTHLMTPQRAIPLSAGTHTIVLVNAQQGVHKTLGVMITAKKSTKVIQDLTRH